MAEYTDALGLRFMPLSQINSVAEHKGLTYIVNSI